MKPEDLKLLVKEKYSEIALQSKEQNESSCCGATGCCSTVDYSIFSDSYSHLEGYVADADLGLGCGLPTEFALIKEGEGPLIGGAIEMMMLDHENHGAMLRQLESLTAGCVPPADASQSWHELYAGLRKLIDDLVEHIHLENNVLFPRFLNKGR